MLVKLENMVPGRSAAHDDAGQAGRGVSVAVAGVAVAEGEIEAALRRGKLISARNEAREQKRLASLVVVTVLWLMERLRSRSMQCGC